jgi:hypothetical protein
MRDFDTLDKVRALFRDPWSPGVKRPPVAVLFEKEKLAALQDHELAGQVPGLAVRRPVRVTNGRADNMSGACFVASGRP